MSAKTGIGHHEQGSLRHRHGCGRVQALCIAWFESRRDHRQPWFGPAEAPTATDLVPAPEMGWGSARWVVGELSGAFRGAGPLLRKRPAVPASGAQRSLGAGLLGTCRPGPGADFGAQLGVPADPGGGVVVVAGDAGALVCS